MYWRPIFNEKHITELINNNLDLIAYAFPIIQSSSIFRGKPGISLFYYYFGNLTNNKKHKERANCLLNESLDFISEKKLNSGFGEGISGILWSLLHLHNTGFIKITSKTIPQEFDHYIFEDSNQKLKNNFYDYIAGGLGGAFYFLQRLPNQFARTSLEIYISQLYLSAERHSFIRKFLLNVFLTNR